MRIIVTGGSGKLGAETVRQLIAAGHEVMNLDRAPPRESLCRFTRIDFTDYGEVVEAMSHIDGGWTGVDAVVHLAAIPGASHAANARTFANNTLSTFNVFQAAKLMRVRNVVWASSETLLGVPFDTPPEYVPIDEACSRRPESAYALSKLVDEVMAAEFCRWDPALKLIGLRFSYVKTPEEYSAFSELQEDPEKQYWNLWSYIDVRDGADAVVRAVSRESTGLEIYIIASPDTVMERPTRDLLALRFPDVPIRSPLGDHQSLLSTQKAHDVLGWRPRYSWRDSLGVHLQTSDKV